MQLEYGAVVTCYMAWMSRTSHTECPGETTSRLGETHQEMRKSGGKAAPMERAAQENSD